MSTNAPFRGPGEAGGNATLTWASPPYAGHGLTQIGRALSIDSGSSRTRVRLFRPKSRSHELVVRVVGHCQTLLQVAAKASGSFEIDNSRVAIESDADGCVITLSHVNNPDRWERETLRWSDGTVHSVASPVVRELETAGRSLREQDAKKRPARRRWLFGS